MNLLLMGLLGLTILLLLYLLHKIRRVHIKLFTVTSKLENISDIKLIETTRQLQLLQTLTHELDLPQGLPPTRGWAASPDFLIEIARDARSRKPERIVECSCGVSTIVLARVVQQNGTGHVHSLEHDPQFAAATRRDLVRYGLETYATVVDAPLISYRHRGEDWPWYDLKNLPDGPIDMLVIDGPPMLTHHHARYPAGPELFPRLNPGAAAYLDDAARPDEREILRYWIEENPHLIIEQSFTEKGCTVLRRP